MIPQTSFSGKLAGIIGWPIDHSLSPRVHGYWLQCYQIDGAYVPLAVRPDDLALALAALPKLGFRGVNVTLPHKRAALNLVDETSEEARRIGALNTIVVAADGHLWGTNTDAFGFSESLRAVGADRSLRQGPAVVVGAGGAARAVCVALLDLGVPFLRLTNRTEAAATALAQAHRGLIEVFPWEHRNEALEGASLLVNTTVLGMIGNPELQLDLSDLPPNAPVVDIVYRPLRTALLRSAAARGHPTVEGIEMLLHQARPGFAAWFGRDPEVTEELRAFVLQGLT
jgi:shikimate dehydrogenase